MNRLWNAVTGAALRFVVWLIEATCPHAWKYEDYDKVRDCTICGRAEDLWYRHSRMYNRYWKV